jgi:hypothetical protein
VESDRLNIYVREGAIMCAAIFNILAEILSKPALFEVCKCLRVSGSFSTKTFSKLKNG